MPGSFFGLEKTSAKGVLPAFACMQVGRLIVVAQLQGNLGPGFALQLQVHFQLGAGLVEHCLLYTSDAADE